MGLRAKFNLVLLLVFAIGLGLFYFLSEPFLRRNAEEEVIQKARIMMESAAGTRKYTVEEIEPLLAGRMEQKFHPQAVSSYAAIRNFEVLHARFPDYAYREVALNPTNLNDRATDWEADIIKSFRSNPEKSDLVSYRDTSTGRYLHLSYPIRAQQQCLVCHSRLEAAPKSMIDAYGTTNGFGWKENEIVGAQVVSVPMEVPLQRARATRLFFIVLLAAVFLLLAILLNVILHFVVLKPISRMSRIASDVSMGKLDVPDYVQGGSDEIASLAASFNRMRRSLEQAIRMIDKRRDI